MSIAASAVGFAPSLVALIANPSAAPTEPSTSVIASPDSGPTVGSASIAAVAPSTSAAASNSLKSGAAHGTTDKTTAAPGGGDYSRSAQTELPTTIALGRVGTSTFVAVVQRASNHVLYTIPPGYLADLINAGYLSQSGYDLRT